MVGIPVLMKLPDHVNGARKLLSNQIIGRNIASTAGPLLPGKMLVNGSAEFVKKKSTDLSRIRA